MGGRFEARDERKAFGAGKVEMEQGVKGYQVSHGSDNAIYALARVLERVLAEPQAQLKSALMEATDEALARDARFLILSMFDDAITIISHLDLPDHRTASQIEMINAYKGKFLIACGMRTVGEFSKAFDGARAVTDINLVGDGVAGANIDAYLPVDRAALRKDTDQLIENLHKSSLPIMEQRVLILKLTAFNRILTECRGMSDDALRRHIKCIYADFCAQIDAFDKDHRSAREALTAWAMKAMKPGIFALALCADATTVVGYIDDNRPKLAITDQSE